MPVEANLQHQRSIPHATHEGSRSTAHLAPFPQPSLFLPDASPEQRKTCSFPSLVLSYVGGEWGKELEGKLFLSLRTSTRRAVDQLLQGRNADRDSILPPSPRLRDSTWLTFCRLLIKC